MSEEETTVEESQEEEEEEEERVEDSGEDKEEPPPKKKTRKSTKAATKATKKDTTKDTTTKDANKDAAKGKKKKRPRKHPKTIDMIVEAIDNMNEHQGSSVQALKAYVLQNFKTVRPDMIKTMMRRALVHGLKNNVLARPKGQSETQLMSGRYLLGKAAMGEEDEVMPQQSRRAKEAQLMKAKAKGKKGKKGKKRKSMGGARRPVAKTATRRSRR
ncbi:hypothetical protein Pmani_018018 [Petrolisthes manimaculis]|uniref:H15 domain-containing protein n=1 Tax=Petrolisthes manimaculis TaxID=1843537 RepID=A0AAE1PM79_9EUCA|nr:hypothetical protein Pmani_018018 [Petrolisthes manimaculis]